MWRDGYEYSVSEGAGRWQGLGLFGIRRFFGSILALVVVTGLIRGALAATSGAADSSPIMTNQWLAVNWDPDGGKFSVEYRPRGLSIVKRIGFSGEYRATPESHPVTDPQWGRGEETTLMLPNGDAIHLRLFNRIPFLMLSARLSNGGPGNRVLTRWSAPEFSLPPALPAGPVRAFGTFGLAEASAGQSGGSYGHLALVEPESRNGTVFAWLTHHKASGVVFFDAHSESITVSPRLDYGRMEMTPGSVLESETLMVGWFPDTRFGLEAYAEAVAIRHEISLPRQPGVYCTWYHAGASDENHLAAQAEFAAENLRPYGLSVIQIDDGWQRGEKINGPRKNFSGARSDGPYPSGMASMASRLRTLGFVPGIWYMPFAGTHAGEYYADKQDFFATRDGQPFEVHWGGTCFDLSRPEVLHHIRQTTHRICREWRYRYIKIDGLWTGMAGRINYINTGYQEDHLGEARLADPEVSHIQAYRAGLRAVRHAAGPDTFILGCNLAQNMRTLGASFGLVDAMRIGPDNGRSWDQMCRGPFSGSNLYFLHGRVWYNDPDPIYVRPDVPLSAARALASWVALTGQLNASSCRYDELPPDRLDLLRRTLPSHSGRPRPVDLFEHRIPRLWYLRGGHTGMPVNIVGAFNWQESSKISISESAERIGLPRVDRLIAFDFWGDKFVTWTGPEIEFELPPQSCRIFAVRAELPRPQVVGTSRHITQGMLDLEEVQWLSNGILEGTSDVVARDPYEIRIWAPASTGWYVQHVQAGKGTAARWRQEGQAIRVTLLPQTSGTTSWQVHFGAAPHP